MEDDDDDDDHHQNADKEKSPRGHVDFEFPARLHRFIAIMTTPISQIELPGIPKLKSGKVREVFDLGDALLFVATDRLSAFDVVLPDPIPEKGRVLTALSEFWFGKTAHIVENHFITSNYDEIQARC